MTTTPTPPEADHMPESAPLYDAEVLARRLRDMATQRFDTHGSQDARGAALWDVACWLVEDVAAETAPLVTTRDAAVDAMARQRYETYDSHFSMPGGLSWEEYKADDPMGAGMYISDGEDSWDALLASGALIDARKIAERVIFDQEPNVDDAAGLWMLIVHDGDTGRPEDWAEAYNRAAALTARAEESK